MKTEHLEQFMKEMEQRIEDNVTVYSVPSWAELEEVVERERYDKEKKMVNHLRHCHTNYDHLTKEVQQWVKSFLHCNECHSKTTLNKSKMRLQGKVKVAVNRKLRELFPKLKKIISQMNKEIHDEPGEVSMAYGKLAGVKLKNYPRDELVTLLMSKNVPGAVRHAAACFIQELLVSL